MPRAKEKWKWVPGYERFYKVSDRGRMLSYYIKKGKGWKIGKIGRLMKIGLDKNGYPVVSLHKNKRNHKCLVHHLVLSTFVGPRPKGKQCAHYNGDCQNNYVENLRWATQKENWKDRKRHGRVNPARGERSSSAKLTKKQVQAMRKRYARGDITYRKLAERYEVTRMTIYLAVSGHNWAWLKS